MIASSLNPLSTDGNCNYQLKLLVCYALWQFNVVDKGVIEPNLSGPVTARRCACFLNLSFSRHEFSDLNQLLDQKLDVNVDLDQGGTSTSNQ